MELSARLHVSCLACWVKISADNIKQEAHGPRFAHLSDIATADMQMLCNSFSNPIIATNENIIIWAVLSFEEEYMGLTVNGAWSIE